MWNKQLALNDVAGQTDAWLCEAAGSICKASGFYTITKTLSETRGIVCRCQKSSLLIIHHVPTLLQDYCAVMVTFLLPFLSVDFFTKHSRLLDIHIQCVHHMFYLLILVSGTIECVYGILALSKFPFWL